MYRQQRRFHRSHTVTKLWVCQLCSNAKHRPSRQNEAIIGSLGTGGESGCAHASHVSAVAQVASSGVAERRSKDCAKANKNRRDRMDGFRKVSIPVIELFIHMVLAFMKGGQEPQTKTAMSAKRSGRGEVSTWYPCFQSVCTLQSCTVRIYLRSCTALDNALAQDLSFAKHVTIYISINVTTHSLSRMVVNKACHSRRDSCGSGDQQVVRLES